MAANWRIPNRDSIVRSHWAYLRALYGRLPTCRELADRLGISCATANQEIRRLRLREQCPHCQGRGFVVRQACNP